MRRKKFCNNISVVLEVSEQVNNVLLTRADDKTLPLYPLSVASGKTLLCDTIVKNQRLPLRKTLLLFSNKPKGLLENKKQGEVVPLPQIGSLQNSC